MVRRTAPALLALLVGAALLTSCSGSGDTSSSSAASSALAGTARDSAAQGQAAQGEAAAAAADVTIGRAVVRTASLSVDVPDLRAAASRARALAEASGGGLESEDASADSDTLRLRVAPERLSAVLDGVSALGKETARTLGTEDVTGTVADLDSRLATQRASVERVRALLARATALSDVVALEGQLAQREGDLESLQARAKAVHDAADLATVTVSLRPVAAVAAPARADGFGDGLRSGVDAFLAAVRVAAVVLGALLPFLPFVAVGAWLARRWTRRPTTPPTVRPAPTV